MDLVRLISQAEYARHRGVSEAAVSKAVKAGRIMLIDGRIDPLAADAQWSRNSRARITASSNGTESVSSSAMRDGGTQPGSDGYASSRARREAAEAQLAELALAEKRGDVIAVAAVEVVWTQALAATRDHLLQLRARLAPLLAAESDPFKVEQLLEAEHHAALMVLSGASVAAKGGVR